MVIEALSLGTTNEEQAYYNAVRALYTGIDIEPASYNTTKKTHTGYGRITFVLPLFQDQTPGVGVVFKDVYIDKNGQMLSGYAETVYKSDNWTTQMVNIDAFFRGGILVEGIMYGDFGAHEVLGIIGDTTNIVVNFKGDGTVDNITVTYTVPTPTGLNEEKITVDGDLIAKVTESEKNQTATVDYYIIKDADNVYYGINLTDGSKIPLGRYDANISKIMANINRNKVDYTPRIDFLTADGNYAFDPADFAYNNNNIYSTHYNKLENSHEYKLRWKFMQAGGTTDRVKVNIPDGIIRNTDNLKFIITQNNTELAYAENSPGDIELTLMPPPTAGEYSILAVVKTVVDGEDTWKLAGRLDILAREHKTYNVTLVSLIADKEINETTESAVQEYLNSTWKKYGISWEVDVDDEFYVDVQGDDGAERKQYVNEILDGDWTQEDKWLSEYKPVQKAINRSYNTYASNKKAYSNETMYVFILPSGKAPYDGQIGDMPLKQQWGYLFVDEFGSTEDYRTLSHELGHGRTALHHTFEDDYIAKYATTNLMDYSDYTNLVRAQWDMAHNPAIFTPLQSDGDGAMNDPNMPAEDIAELIKSVRDAKMQNKNNLDITEFSLSFGKRTELELTDMQLADVIVLTSGKMKTIMPGQPGESRYEPLYIVPSDFSVESDKMIAKSKGLTGYFTKYTFPQYIKNGDSYTKSSTSALIIIVRGKQTQTFKAYLNGDPVPDIKFPCEVCGRELEMNIERLRLILGANNANATSVCVDAINTSFKHQDIQFNTCKKQAHFFSQSFVETSGFKKFSEDYHYQLLTIYSKFSGQSNNIYKTLYNQDFWDKNQHLDYISSNLCPYRFEQKDTTGTDKSIRYKGDGVNSKTYKGLTIKFPESFILDNKGKYFKVPKLTSNDEIEKGKNLFNLVYSNKEGNGDPSSGDGWRYRGRGIMHLTNFNNYQKTADLIKNKFSIALDITNDKDLLKFQEDMSIIIYSGVIWFYNAFKPLDRLNTMTSNQVTSIVNTAEDQKTKRASQYDSLVEDSELFKCFLK